MCVCVCVYIRSCYMVDNVVFLQSQSIFYNINEKNGKGERIIDLKLINSLNNAPNNLDTNAINPVLSIPFTSLQNS